MSFEELGGSIVNIEYLLEKDIRKIKNIGPDAKIMLEICSKYKTLACAMFLINYDVEQFVLNLRKSGDMLYRLYCENAKRPLDQYYMTASMAKPIFDVLAIRDFKLVRKIADLLPNSCMIEQGELEDDFIIIKTLTEFAREKPDFKRINENLDKLKAITEGNNQIQLGLLEIMASDKPDAVHFDENFREFVEQWRSDIDAKIDVESREPHKIQSLAYIFIKGLCFLRLAEKLGLTFDLEYFGIPDVLIKQAKVIY